MLKMAAPSSIDSEEEFMRYLVTRIMLLLSLTLLSLALPLHAADKKAEDTSKMVEPTHLGTVIGHVYDAVSERPLAGAAICIQKDGVFPAPDNKGKVPQRGAASPLGEYKCRAELGRISKSIDAWKLLNSSLIGLMTGSAQKVTKRIDVSFFNIRVECPGYHPFEGTVPVKAYNGEGFSVTMEPILLMPDSSREISTVAVGWGVARIVDLQVSPAIASPKSKVRVTVLVKSPPIDKSVKMGLSAFCSYAKKLKFGVDAGGETPEGMLRYVGEFNLPAAKKAGVGYLSVSLTGCPFDIQSGGSSRGTMLQIVTTPEETKLAELRLKAYLCRARENNVEALQHARALCEHPLAIRDDFAMLAAICEAVHEYPGAIAAWKRTVEMAPAKERLLAMAPYANALSLGGEHAAVLAELEPEYRKVKPKELTKKVPVQVVTAIGVAYLNGKQLEQAAEINRKLTGWPGANNYPPAQAFQTDLRLAQVEADLRARPDDAQAWANYGRALLDMRRWEEAAVKLHEALRRDSSLSSVQWDLNYALLQSRGGAAQGESLDDAIARARQAAIVSEGKKERKSKDFFTWHTLAILQYRKSAELQAAGKAEAAAEMVKQCRESLTEALMCGREGKEQVKKSNFYGVFGYYGSDVKTITGFAYAEADQDFIILEGLKTLVQQPDEYLTRLNMAAAFLALGLPAIADETLAPCLRAHPECIEAQYVHGLIILAEGRRAQAVTLLKGVVAANPRHPAAHLKLAAIYSEDGDMAAASACLAAHARYYSSTR